MCVCVCQCALNLFLLLLYGSRGFCAEDRVQEINLNTKSVWSLDHKAGSLINMPTTVYKNNPVVYINVRVRVDWSSTTLPSSQLVPSFCFRSLTDKERGSPRRGTRGRHGSSNFWNVWVWVQKTRPTTDLW